jgi:hypothetical protein
MNGPSFGSFMKPLFCKRRPVEKAGKPLFCKDDPKRLALIAEAKDILDQLPGPGQSLHLLMTGRYDLMHLLLVVFHQRQEPIDHLRIATLSFNKKNLAEILELLDTGKVKRLSFVFSKFFKEHSTDVYQLTAAELRKRGQRFAAPRSHAKVVCCQWQGGDKLTMEGSANLRSNSNQEQLALFTDAALHDWHARWIDGLIDKHETETIDQGQGPGAG